MCLIISTITVCLHVLQFQGSPAAHSTAARCLAPVLQGQSGLLWPHHLLWDGGRVVERGGWEAKQGVSWCVGHVSGTEAEVSKLQQVHQQS